MDRFGGTGGAGESERAARTVQALLEKWAKETDGGEGEEKGDAEGGGGGDEMTKGHGEKVKAGEAAQAEKAEDKDGQINEKAPIRKVSTTAIKARRQREREEREEREKEERQEESKESGETEKEGLLKVKSAEGISVVEVTSDRGVVQATVRKADGSSGVAIAVKGEKSEKRTKNDCKNENKEDDDKKGGSRLTMTAGDEVENDEVEDGALRGRKSALRKGVQTGGRGGPTPPPVLAAPEALAGGAAGSGSGPRHEGEKGTAKAKEKEREREREWEREKEREREREKEKEKERERERDREKEREEREERVLLEKKHFEEKIFALQGSLDRQRSSVQELRDLTTSLRSGTCHSTYDHTYHNEHD